LITGTSELALRQWINSALLRAVFEEIGVTAFVNERQKVNHITFDQIVNIERKRLRPSARKTVGTDMVATTPFDYLPNLASDPLAESASKAL
jgi:hypothetical protein